MESCHFSISAKVSEETLWAPKDIFDRHDAGAAKRNSPASSYLSHSLCNRLLQPPMNSFLCIAK